MAFTQEQKDAHNRECKKNFNAFNQRISSLEKEIESTSEPVKILRSVQKIQRELAKKDINGWPELKMFRNNRSQFFDRLNLLFSSVNNIIKSAIRDRLKNEETRIQSGNFNIKKLMDELNEINRLWYAVPIKDSEKNELKQLIDEAFTMVKSSGKTGQKSPEIDRILKEIEGDISNTRRQIRSLGQPQLAAPDYQTAINTLKTQHGLLRDIQKKIKDGQIKLKTVNMDGKSCYQYSMSFQALWEKQNECWNEPALNAISNFCEELTSSNFQYYITQLETIEAKAETNITRDVIAKMQGQLKTLELSLKEKSRPLKFEHWKEFFDRAWACKQRLNGLWNGITVAASKEFDSINTEIQKLHTSLDRSRSKPELEKVKQGCRELHTLRKAKQQKLTPGQNHRLMKDINELYGSATDLIQQIAPQDFSFEWLKDAYQRNVENRWVIFVSDVPDISA